MATKDVLLNEWCTNFERYTVTGRSHDDSLANPDVGETCCYPILFHGVLEPFPLLYHRKENSSTLKRQPQPQPQPQPTISEAEWS